MDLKNSEQGLSTLNPLAKFELDPDRLLLTENGEVPLLHWPVAPNFGDDLSPWLFGKLTQRPIFQNDGSIPSYISIGSILGYVTDKCIVWGTGSFGPEPPRAVNKRATYTAVRGPLTRSRVLDRGAACPRVYGDPALLTPFFYTPPNVEKRHEIGLVLRWSEGKWSNRKAPEGVKIIDLGTSDVESVLQQILSCKRIITSSLHGLIIADAYGIPSAWLSSRSPKGHEFKFYDYFLSVEKVRHATEYDMVAAQIDVATLDAVFDYDDRKIQFDYDALLDACPFLRRKP